MSKSWPEQVREVIFIKYLCKGNRLFLYKVMNFFTKLRRNIVRGCLNCRGSVRPKGFFLFRPKPKLAEIVIFYFGRNRYRNQKIGFVLAETDTETEMPILEDTPILESQGIFLFKFSFDYCPQRSKNSILCSQIKFK